MEDTHRKISNHLTGAMDSSSHPMNIAENDYLWGLNLCVGTDKKKNTVPGNKLFWLAATDETCIGTYSDKENNSLIYFIYSQSNNHKIVRWFPDAQTVQGLGKFYVLAHGQKLGFKKDWLITHIELVDNKYLYWTDAQTTSTTIEGNPPRMLDISRSNDQEKIIEYYLVYDDNSFQPGNNYDLIVYDINHNITAEITPFFVGDGTTDQVALLAELRSALQVYDISIEIIDKYCFKVYHNDIENFISIDGPNIRFYEHNSYPYRKTTVWFPDYDSDLIKIIPAYPLRVDLNFDLNYKSNNIADRTFQFIARYVFKDNSKSAWSDISQIRANIKYNQQYKVLLQSDSYNCLRVTIPKIIDVPLLCGLKGVEIAVRNGVEKVFRMWKTYKPYELALNQVYEQFYNDTIYSVVASDANAVQGTQALKNYDFVPELCGTLSLVNDENGNSIIIVGSGLEGKTVTTPVNIEFEVIETQILNSSAFEQSYMSLKRRGRYRFGIIYGDVYGRRSSVREDVEFSVPYFGEPNQLYSEYTFPTLRVKIHHRPPKWARYYWIVRTNEMNYSSFVHVPAHVMGVSIKKNNQAPEDPCYEFGSFEDHDDYVAIRLTTVSTYHKECIENMDWFKGLNEGYVTNFDKNFRIRFLYTLHSSDGGQAFYPAPDNYDFEIEGIVVSPYGNNEYVILIDKKHAQIFEHDPHKTGAGATQIFEIYQRKTGNDEGFYEIYKGDVGYTGQTLARHNGNVQHQSDTGPAIVEFQSIGDVFNKAIYQNLPPEYISTYGYNQSHGETMFLNYSKPTSTGNSVGWLNIQDFDVEAKFYFNQLRTSDTYIPDGRINGLSAFRGLNYIKLPKEMGAIKKTVQNRMVFMVICQRGTQPFYVNRDQVMDLRGDNLIGRTDRLLNQALQYKAELGTDNPESIALFEGIVYGFDNHRGIPWRYNSNGLMPIYQKNKELFEGQNIRNNGFIKTVIPTVYDPILREFVISFGDVTIRTGTKNEVIVGQTWAYGDIHASGEEFMGWIGQRSYVPEMYGVIGTKVVSFVGGNMWVHNRADVPDNNFYGQQFHSAIKLSVGGSFVKQFWNIRVVAFSKWYSEPEKIVIFPTEFYPTGMTSELPAANFRNINGAWWSMFLRNQSDKHSVFLDIEDETQRKLVALYQGEKLRGEVMTIELRNGNNGTADVLQRIDVEIDFVNPTKL